MKVAVIGSRSLKVENLDDYLPPETDTIITGGAQGIDRCARDYAIKNGIKLTEFLPEYEKYGKAAPLKRNLQIIECCDRAVVFWDGKSHGTKYVIDNCKRLGVPVEVIML